MIVKIIIVPIVFFTKLINFLNHTIMSYNNDYRYFSYKIQFWRKICIFTIVFSLSFLFLPYGRNFWEDQFFLVNAFYRFFIVCVKFSCPRNFIRSLPIIPYPPPDTFRKNELIKNKEIVFATTTIKKTQSFYLLKIYR